MNPIGFERHTQEAPTDELLPSDFIQFGMEAELMGRIGRCVRLDALTAEDLRLILTTSELSVFRYYQRFFESRGHRLTLNESEIDTLIADALSRGMGARGLNALVEEWVEPALFRIAEGA